LLKKGRIQKMTNVHDMTNNVQNYFKK